MQKLLILYTIVKQPLRLFAFRYIMSVPLIGGDLMNYISVKEASEKWNMTPRRVQVLCNQNRIEGAQRVGSVWIIPEVAEKPDDARKKTEVNSHRKKSKILIERVWSMPNKHTFEIKPIHALIEEELTEGLWIDPFANRNKIATVTNDLSVEYDTDYHLDALDFMKMFDTASVDGVLYDPPYSPRQVSECYNNVGYNVTWDTTKASFWGNHKREISRIVKKGGKVITFGWNSGGIGNKYGFEIYRILLVPHGGWHNDTICTVEIKTHEGEISTMEQGKTAPQISQEVSLLTDTDKKVIEKLSALPEGYWDFKDDDTREYTHGLHNYPAMMVCPISRNIIKMMKELMPISNLFDPFSGSGTVLVEGMLAALDAVSGNDINPLALLLTKVKTTNLNITELQMVCTELKEKINSFYEEHRTFFDDVDEFMRDELSLDLTDKKGWGAEAPSFLQQYCEVQGIEFTIPDFKNIGYWFKPQVILFLQAIKDQIKQIENKDILDFVYVSFSESIRLVSNRRNGEFKMFRMPVAKVSAFAPNVRKDFYAILDRNVEKMNAFDQACSERGTRSNITIYKNDAALLIDVPDNTFDLIVTSPPYGDSRTTVAYGEYSRLSLQWIGLYDLSEKEIMGLDRSLMGGKKYRNGFEYLLNSSTLKEALEQIKDVDIERAGDVYSFYDDLEHSIAATANKMKKGGYEFWVVGNRTVKNVLLQTDVIISEMATHYGLRYVHTVDRNIPNKVMPSFNSPTNEVGKKVTTMTNEHIVILCK